MRQVKKSSRTFALILLVLPTLTFSQNAVTESGPVPFSTLFYNIDTHILGSFTHNYGINHILGASGTYGIVRSGIDWKFYTFARDNRAIPYVGFSSVIIGGLVPVAIPAWLYFRGKSQNDNELQITAMALGQAALLGLIVSSSYKAVTGRKPPEVFEDSPTEPDFSSDFKFGFLNRGVFDGWPSGHTMSAFAMATTLIELYPENESLKLYAILYASIIGLGVSTNIHWFSDAVAGALIGYSIGKTVGKGFRKLKGHNDEDQAYSFTITPLWIRFSHRF